MDARPLGLGRILVGLASLPIALEWAIPLLKAASGDYLVLPVFDGWKTLPDTAVLILLAISLVSSLAMILGIAGRLPSLLVAVCGAVAILSDQQAYSNHLLLLVMLSFFIGVSGATNAISISAGINKTQEVPYWPAFLIKMQITTVYAWTAAAKVNDQYLAGDVLRMNLQPWVPVPDHLLPAIAMSSIAAEAFLAVALWIPKLRLLAFMVGGALHLGIVLTLIQPAPLIPFGLLMMTGYVLFAHDSILNGRWNMTSFGRRSRSPSMTGVRE